MKGGIILSLLFFIMGLIVVVTFISPMNDIIDWAQQSDNLNCKGYIYGGNVTHPLSFNNVTDGGQSGNPLACLTFKIYIPYILLVFLIGGISSVLGGRGAEMIGLDEGNSGGYSEY